MRRGYIFARKRGVMAVPVWAWIVLGGVLGVLVYVVLIQGNV